MNLHELTDREFASIELIYVSINKESGKIGETHQIGSGIDAGSSYHNLTLIHGYV